MTSMKRFFNTADPCDPRDHYMLSVLDPINRELYFILHAPRQIGKTTTLLSLARELTQSRCYVAVLVSTEVGVGFPQFMLNPCSWIDSFR